MTAIYRPLVARHCTMNYNIHQETDIVDHSVAATADAGADHKSGHVVIPFFQGFLDEEHAKHSEQSHDYQNDHLNKSHQTPKQRSPFSYLYGGKRPQMGQRVETVVHFEQHQQQGQQQQQRPQHELGDQQEDPTFVSYRLSGIVTQVGELPTLEEWVPNQSMVVKLPTCHFCGLSPNHIPRTPTCPVQDCITNQISQDDTRPFNLHSLMQTYLETHGTIHGQQIVTYQMVTSIPQAQPPPLHQTPSSSSTTFPAKESHQQPNRVSISHHLDYDTARSHHYPQQHQHQPDPYHHQPIPLPPPLLHHPGRIYRITCQFNDNMMNKWTIVSIEDVADSTEPPPDLPSVFLI